MGDSIRGIGMMCGRCAGREIEEFSEGAKIPHPGSAAHTEQGLLRLSQDLRRKREDP